MKSYKSSNNLNTRKSVECKSGAAYLSKLDKEYNFKNLSRKYHQDNSSSRTLLPTSIPRKMSVLDLHTKPDQSMKHTKLLNNLCNELGKAKTKKPQIDKVKSVVKENLKSQARSKTPRASDAPELAKKLKEGQKL